MTEKKAAAMARDPLKNREARNAKKAKNRRQKYPLSAAPATYQKVSTGFRGF